MMVLKAELKSLKFTNYCVYFLKRCESELSLVLAICSLVVRAVPFRVCTSFKCV